ncbi:MAG: dicarboxylate/amino acid:cation symporter [Planctomycetota bacterium]|nr:dicarboxylate/amino acid:cation symporter [Planctomycetota bacterium]MDA1250689.1 dicarboxylate/amino acid:cation symporter [Planctomycetota bacterium]
MSDANETPADKKPGMPLYVQIAIALVVGTVLGVFINPGSVTVKDDFVDVSLTASFTSKENDDGTLIKDSWLVQVVDANGFETVRRRFDSQEALVAKFPELAATHIEASPGKPVPASIEVSDRSVRIIEAGGSITIDYLRRHQADPESQTPGAPVSTTLKVKSARELPESWQKFHAEHGGGWRRKMTAFAKYIGDLFLRLLKMITVPLIVTSLITGVAGLGGTERFGAMFGRTLLYYFATSVLAITTGLIIVNIIRPGIGAELPGGTEQVLAGEDQSLSGVLLGLLENMIPTNPISSLASGDFLSIITFSILFGVFIIKVGGRTADTLRDFFEATFQVMMRLTMAIIALAPIGVFAFMTYATASQGLQIFLTLAWYMLAVFLALLIHAAITLPLIVKFVAKRSPLEFFKAMTPALMTAFSTASSNGTLPLTMTQVEQKAGISNRVSSFVLPLGATINMDGTALYEAVAVLFIAQAFGGNITVGEQIVVAITALLASVGAAGIPHAGLVMMAIVLQAVNLPLEAQGVIIAVDRVLDMCRTSVNVWSDSCGCAVIARFDNGSGEADAVSS